MFCLTWWIARGPLPRAPPEHLSGIVPSSPHPNIALNRELAAHISLMKASAMAKRKFRGTGVYTPSQRLGGVVRSEYLYTIYPMYYNFF